jgi:hypothetical protein
MHASRARFLRASLLRQVCRVGPPCVVLRFHVCPSPLLLYEYDEYVENRGGKRQLFLLFLASHFQISIVHLSSSSKNTPVYFLSLLDLLFPPNTVDDSSSSYLIFDIY